MRRLFISIASTTATATSKRSDEDGPDPVPDTVSGDQGQPDAEQREDQTDQRGEVLQQHDRQLRAPGSAG